MPRNKNLKEKGFCGRPLKPIDWADVDKMIKNQNTGVEIALEYNMHPNTFYDRVLMEKGISFTEYYSLVRQSGFKVMRNNYIARALNGNTTLMANLGEEYLGFGNKDKAPPNDKEVDQKLIEIETAGKLLQEIKSLKEELDALKRKTDPQLLSSESPI